MNREIEISGVNMRAISEAKASHHKTCAAPAWGVAMHIIAIERCGWEEGEEIVGLKLECDNNLSTMEFVLLCDANRPPITPEEVEEEHQKILENVEREKVPAGIDPED
jgi:hypothetical protein